MDVEERERQPAAAVTTTRAAWGLLLLTRPRTVARVLGGNPTPSPAGRRLLRVLGLRHLAQVAASTDRPTNEVLVAGAVVDALHAVTALGYGLSGRSRRRAGLVDAGIAGAFAVATFIAAPMPSGDGTTAVRKHEAADEGAPVPAAVVTAAALTASAAAGWWLLRSRREAARRDRARRTPRGGPGALRYRVPDHQDPAVLMAALAKAGHRAELEWTGGAHYLTISCEDVVAERPRVRSVIERTPAMSFSGPDMAYAPVVFEDEASQIEA